MSLIIGLSILELVLVLMCGVTLSQLFAKRSKSNRRRLRSLLYLLLALASIAITAKTLLLEQDNDERLRELVTYAREANLEYVFLGMDSRDAAGGREPRAALVDVELEFSTYLYRDRKFEESGTRLLRALPLDSSAVFLNNLGVIDVKMGNVEKAHARFQQALEREPRNAAVQWNLGLLLVQHQQPEQGIIMLVDSAEGMRE